MCSRLHKEYNMDIASLQGANGISQLICSWDIINTKLLEQHTICVLFQIGLYLPLQYLPFSFAKWFTICKLASLTNLHSQVLLFPSTRLAFLSVLISLFNSNYSEKHASNVEFHWQCRRRSFGYLYLPLPFPYVAPKTHIHSPFLLVTWIKIASDVAIQLNRLKLMEHVL